MKCFRFPLLSVLLALLAGPAFASFQAIHTPPQMRTAVVEKSKSFWRDFFDLLSGRQKMADLSVTVRNAATGAPLANATVLVGTSEGVPFSGNKVATDASGVAVFTHPWLKEGRNFSITAASEGFSNASAINVRANQAELSLVPQLRGDEFSFLEGKVYGWPTGYDKSTLEVGFFLPGIRPASLTNFDPQQIVSSYKVEMDVYGKRMVPGNVVMPHQEKRYILFPVTLNKPEFTMPLPRNLTAHMSSVIGVVPIGKAIDAMRSKDFLGVLNLATMTHVNWTDRMTVDENQRFDLTATRPLQQKMLSARYAGVPAKLDVVAISAVDPANDRGDLVAMDVKSLKSEEIRGGRGNLALGGLSDLAPNSYIFSAMFDRNQFNVERAAQITTRALTGRLQKVTGTEVQADRMLNIIRPGNVTNQNRHYDFTSPNAPALGVNADFLVMTIYAEVPNATTQGKVRNVVWTAVLPCDSTSVQLPDLGKPVLPPPGQDWTFFWEIVAVKSNSTAQWNSGFDLSSSLSGLEYVSSMARKF